MSEQTIDLAAWLDGLEEARKAATPGVWKLWGMSVMADQDGTSNADTAVDVAQTFFRDENGKPRTFDAQLICKAHRALPELVAALRGVLALAESWRRTDQPLSLQLAGDDLHDCVLSAVVAAAHTEEGR